jgi:Protein of unknown function (DUF3892)
MVDKVNYWISEVCYKDNHIYSVRIYEDSQVAYGLEETWTVNSVIDTINKGYNISTMINKNGIWQAGAKVEVVNIEGTSYIRTDKDASAEDSLENLPKF